MSIEGLCRGKLYPPHGRRWAALENVLSRQLLDSTDVDITSASCLSIGSLKLQDAMLQTFKKEAIQAVDMECASVFAAAARAGLQAAALFYATDVIGEKPFHAELSSEDKAILKSAIRDAVHILCGFIETKLNA